MRTDQHLKRWATLLFVTLVFAVSLLLRIYRLTDIQPHHDEAPMFGYTSGQELHWNGSLEEFLNVLFKNAVLISEGDTPPPVCILAELFRFVFGENLAVARWFHAIVGSLTVALVAWLARKIFVPPAPAATAVAAVASFALVSIVFGQFGEMYALYLLASAVQYAAYWLLVRKGFSWRGYLEFAVVAFTCTLFEYLQILVTVGILLASVFEKSPVLRGRRLLRAVGSLGVYMLVNLIPLMCLYAGAGYGLKMGHRLYLDNNYPARWLTESDGCLVIRFFWYFLSRTYDLFNYHLALVFNPRWYCPLQWNWLFLPFILLAGGALFLRLRRRENFRHSPSGVWTVLGSMLVVYMVGNALFLVPYGGVRNSLFIAPLIWLAYGDLARIYRLGLGKCRAGFLLAGIVVILPVFIWLVSLPGFYRDRVSRFDGGEIMEAVLKYKPDTLIMPQATYHPFLMLLQKRKQLASFLQDQPDLTVTSFFEFEDDRWGKYPIPVPGDKVLALDLYQSWDGGREGRGITKDHPNLQTMFGPGWTVRPLIQNPGPHIGIREHQSIYFPPNSFYLYLLERKNQSPEGEKGG